MIKIKKFVIPMFVFLMLVMPVVSLAYRIGEPIVPLCDTTSVPGQCIWGWKEFLALINNVISFILKVLALPIAAIMFAYAGFLLVTSGGSTEARGKAKNIFTNTAIGLIIVAGAYLIIRTILSILGYDGAWIGFNILPIP